MGQLGREGALIGQTNKPGPSRSELEKKEAATGQVSQLQPARGRISPGQLQLLFYVQVGPR